MAITAEEWQQLKEIIETQATFMQSKERTIKALPVDRLVRILKKHLNVVSEHEEANGNENEI